MGYYLVTGVAGFIGWRVGEFLLKEGKAVLGVDNLNDAYDVTLKYWRLNELKKSENFKFYQIDITNFQALKTIFETYSISAVIHLAARAGVRASLENPWVYVDSNITGTLNLLELMKDFGVKKLVLASTSSIYAGQSPPFHEDLKVDTPLSPYAATKKGAELLSYTYHHLYGLDISVVRYFTVYGPAGRPDMSIFRFIKWIYEEKPIKIFGDGTQARDFTYIDDIARGTIASLKPLGYEIINLGGGKNPISINQIIEILERLIGKKAKREYLNFHKADVKVTWADISKAKKLLNWEPEISIEEGLKRTVNWSKENIELIKSIKV
ncbi:UDP-glucuronate 5'-epimerase [Thermodesulfobacterium geofontis OPF15]|jgi:nucleoside-diphosphate-sugar epimerase|uniref:UDP-glucuronate 4-epimerase n=1 Tax=Thermodesulfobacterium geofontis (strain OPF15) TaxID=795359 RepID=UGA4E_THEGP|nr:GDP-mannose 4,6-dehydratase [Thermodesulfobacterium geofontis]F8C4X8.1 RecName: Full=UDP-glucuronate 4-epimerase; Short=UGA4E; AltName: Full=TgUGAE [Thermodesulfobacterium geofontis OPF15]AEH22762.1 UDP-glucuronate 5'-epimerase [Thermodesulfobacterium geofontis OPF15]